MRKAVKMSLAKGTRFQRRVWKEVQKVPPGTTISYKELAKRIGRPKAARAVANALAKNPLPVVIPCHRVIGSDGRLGGYSARGGVRRKAQLLLREKRQARVIGYN